MISDRDFRRKSARLHWPRALLAQLVEHLHGKEGVDGSSPSEGFAKALDTAPFLYSPLPNEAASRPFWKADGKSDAPGTIEA